jgi:predicted  nucleic acid-binding Zn-ribbon protein
MQTTLHAHIEELSRDMTASFRQLADYQIQTERRIDARFDKIETDIATLKDDMVAMDARFDKIEADIATVKEDMVAMEGRIKEDMVAMESRIKGDMAAVENRIMDAFKQLVTTIDSRLPAPQQ